MAQDFADRSLKTQTQLRFGDVGMAGPISNHENNSSGYEERVSQRRLLRLLSLDFVSTMAVESGEASWAMGESSSLWIWPGPSGFSTICGMGGLLSGLLPQVSQPKRNSKAEPWGRVKGQPNYG